METSSDKTKANGDAKPIQAELSCPSCAWHFVGDLRSDSLACPKCGRPVKKLERLAILLDKWYYPRRWLAAVNRPRVHFLLEQLWSANGQGEKLYRAVAPANTNYEIFLHAVTRAVARGVEEGWADIVFPEDPLEENPVYRLEFKDPERFSTEVAALFPEVNWDETVEVEEEDLPDKVN